jgi:4a-hydroxytetrahydrobiopterin dehydratase
MAADARKLETSEIEEALADLPGWAVKNGKLHKTFEFENFVEALGWMVRAGFAAEALDHHPDWSNSWNKVEVTLSTHSINALSQYDLKLARKMEKLD